MLPSDPMPKNLQGDAGARPDGDDSTEVATLRLDAIEWERIKVTLR